MKNILRLRTLAFVCCCAILVVPLLSGASAMAAPCFQFEGSDMLLQFFNNLRGNLFKPLLLFFMVGIAIPLLKIHLEFPFAVYQGLIIYLLIAIGWHGGEELAVLPPQQLLQAAEFMLVGFLTNLAVGFLAYFILRTFVPTVRRVDSAVVAGYYGSDSAGTFLTCLGTLQAAKILCAPYMPVMLAVMEIPGCLVSLLLVSRLRKKGMGLDGYMSGETRDASQVVALDPNRDPIKEEESIALEMKLAPEARVYSWRSIAKEVFLNPGLFLLLSGITIGFISRLQGPAVVREDDRLFVGLFQGILCLFLLEMGMTAAKRMEDLKRVDWRFIAFAILSPNLFACMGMGVCYGFSSLIHQSLDLGTYVLFAVLCASASYIAMPAVQRLAIPEASPTLPLAASLGVTFVYNVTVGIPFYMLIAQQLLKCS